MKDKNVAGILALFFGPLGIHRFYLGQTGLGILYLFFCWLLPIMLIIGLIDAISFFSMDQENFDFKYNREFLRTKRRHDTDFDRSEYDRQERREKRSEYRRERRREYAQERERKPDPYTRQRKQTPVPPQQTPRPASTPRANPFKSSGIRKYKDFDYDGAIEDFNKALEVNPKDVAVHFNLACAYSLNENKDKAFYHLDRAVDYGFNDFKRIKQHDALAFLRIQPQFEEFEKNQFRLIQQLEAPREDLLGGTPDLLEQLQKLGELREKGLLTEDEFVAQKKKLLG